jgi:hypothetical protein
MLFDDVGMSTGSGSALNALGGHLGTTIRDERRRRRWTLRELAARSGISASHVAWLEALRAASRA